jgi:hypothetical protein
VLDFDLHQPSTVLKIPRFYALTVTAIPTFPFLQLATESSVRPALTCTARIIQLNSGLNENECLTIEPPQRTLCGGIRLHSMQESPGSNRETIGTHSLHSLRFRTWYAITYAAYRR